MDLFKLVENLESTVESTLTQAAKSVVESTSEFPDRKRAAAAAPVATEVAVSRTKKAGQGWTDVNWQARVEEWQAAAAALRADPATRSGPGAGRQLLALYEVLVALPDPQPALQGATALAAKVTDLEADNRRLSAALASAEADTREVGGLVAKHQAEVAAHAALAMQHAALQEEVTALREAAGAAVQEELQQATSTIAQLQSTLASLRAEHDAAQSALFEAQATAEAAAGGRGAAEAMLAAELERLQQQLAEALAGREAAAAALAAHQQQQSGGGLHAGSSGDSRGSRPGSPGPGGSSSRAGDVVWQTRLSAAESAAATAQRAADAATSRAAQLAHDNQLLTSQVGVLTSQVDRLTRELGRRPTPAAAAAMAQQMAGLSLLVGQQLEAEGWDPAAAAEAVGACRPDSLAAQLADRNTKLTAALGAAKATAAQEGEARTAAEARLQELEASLADSQSLVTQLELDLAAVSAGSSSGSGGTSGVAHQQLLLGGEAAGGGSGAEGDAADPTAAAGGEGGGDARVMLGVVVAQRDRLKQRVAKLEDEVAALTAAATASQQQMSGLTADNVALVEKLRYLEAYRDTGGGGSGGAGAGGGTRGSRQAVLSVDDAGVASDPAGAAASRVHRYGCGPLALEIRGGGEGRDGGGRRRMRADRAGGPLACWGVGQEEEEAGVEAKYRRAYEAKLNPWAGFQAAEVEAAKGALGLHDRALLAGSRLVVGSRAARVAVAVYAVVLHVFIMLLLYAASNRHASAVVDVSGGAGGAAVAAVGPPEPRVLPAGNGTAAAAGVVPAAAAGVGRLVRRLLLGDPYETNFPTSW